MADPEVAVVGLGIMGSCTLWQLAARGVRAVGCDRFDPPHAEGASQGHSRVIRRIQFEGAQYVPLAARAYELWAQLERDTGRRLFTRCGLLLIGPHDSQLIRGARESADRTGVAYELLDAAELGRRYPPLRVAPDEIALLDPDAGYISPEEAVAAVLERAVALGAEVRRDSAVENLDELPARRVVVAAGGWVGTLLPEVAPTITLERHFFAWLPVREPELFAPERFPIWIRENRARTGTSIEESHAHSERIAAFGVPAQDGRTVKMGSPLTGLRVDSPRIDRAPRPEELAALSQEHVDEWLDGVIAEPSGFNVCHYDNSPDGHFIIGPPPGRPDVTVLAGFSGHGFKHAPAVGEIGAALACGEPPPLDVSPWSPLRLVGAR